MHEVKKQHVHALPKAIAPMDDPRMADFVAASPKINALAETSPGFVWRYNPQGVESFNIRPFDDPLIYITLSVWESVEALKTFVFNPEHQEIMSQRAKWFLPLEPHLVLWWIPKGRLPSIEDAKNRLEILKQQGPSPQAFTFLQVFPPEKVPLT